MLERADAYEREGRLLDVIDVLTEANHAERDVAIERRLVDVRNRAIAELDGPGRDVWPPVIADEFDVAPGAIPEAHARDLSAEVIGSGISNHGSVLVRDLVPPET